MEIDKEYRSRLMEFLSWGYITKSEMSREIDIAYNTLKKVLDEDNTIPWSTVTRVRVRDFIDKYEKENNG